MKRYFLAVFAALMAFGAVQADEGESQVEMKFVVAGDGEETIRFDSQSAGFEPADLAVGETRSIPNDAGKDISMTRTEDGLEINVDGKKIPLPDISAHGGHMMVAGVPDVDMEVMHLGDMDEAVNVEVVGTHAIRAHGPDGVTIISKTPLDDSVRESIRSVLISAGIDEEVTFVDGSGEGHQVRVIRRVETL